MADASDADQRDTQPKSPDVLSVSDLNERISSFIEQSSDLQGVRCIGEVTDLHQNCTALYCTLTDGDAELSCMIWANRYRKMDAALEDGTEVILEGDIDYWTEGGKIDLKPDEVSLEDGRDLYDEGQKLLSEIRGRLQGGNGEVVEIE